MMPPGHPISLCSLVSVSPHQVSAELGDEVVILDTRESVYAGLDGVGAAIWRWLKKPITVADLHQRILAAYEVEPRAAEDDLLSLLDTLAQRGLIEVHLEPRT